MTADLVPASDVVAAAVPADVVPAGPTGVVAGDRVHGQSAVDHARALLAAIGIPCTDESTVATPARMVRALEEMTAGLRVDPDRHLAVTFPSVASEQEDVLVSGIRFDSVCEHHVLPFSGVATVSYLPAPGGRIAGLSKIPRMVEDYARRPQVQERLGQQIVDSLTRNLDALGAACLLRSTHSCASVRGVRSRESAMTTRHFTGAYRDDPALRSEFLLLAGAPPGHDG